MRDSEDNGSKISKDESLEIFMKWTDFDVQEVNITISYSMIVQKLLQISNKART